MSIPGSGCVSMKCIANEYGFCETTLPISLDDLSNLIKSNRCQSMNEFRNCSFDNTASWILTGGGGGAGGIGGGGGGAGGYTWGCFDIISCNGCTINIVIGGGGTGQRNATSTIDGTNGNSSSFTLGSSTTYAVGGGGKGGSRTCESGINSITPQSGMTIQSGEIGSGGSGGGGYGGVIGIVSTLGASGANGGCQGGAGQYLVSGGSGGGGGGSCRIGFDGSEGGSGGNGCISIVAGSRSTYASGGNSTSGQNGPSGTGNGGCAAGVSGGGNGGSGSFIVSYYSVDGSTKLVGGTCTFIDKRVIHTFTNSGTLNIGTTIKELNIEYLVVGGGGGVGWCSTAFTNYAFPALGGAGGGQVREGSTTLCSNCQYVIVVGAGGSDVAGNLSRICTTTGTSIAISLGGQSISNITTSQLSLTASTVGESYISTSSNLYSRIGACAVATTNPIKGFQGGTAPFIPDVHWDLGNYVNRSFSFSVNNAFSNAGNGVFDVSNLPQLSGGGGGAGSIGGSPICLVNAQTELGCSNINIVYSIAGKGGDGVCSTNFGGRYGGGGGGSVMTGVLSNEIIGLKGKTNGKTGEFLQFTATRFLTSGGSASVVHIFEFGCGTDGGGNGSSVPRTATLSLNSYEPTGRTFGIANTGGGSGGLSPTIDCGINYGSVNGYTTLSNGGSGVVAIRYLGSTAKALGGTITCSNGYVYHCFTSSGNLSLT